MTEAIESTSSAKSAHDLDEIAEQAAIWGFPLVQFGRYLAKTRADGFPFNRLMMNTRLAEPDLKIVGPNIDTLYGLAWLDLRDGPMVLEVPASAGRYYSFQFCDAYEETFAYAGSRSTGPEAGVFAIVPPGWQGRVPEDIERIDAPTSICLAVGRTHVLGPEDLQTAQRVHTSFTLGPLSEWPGGQKKAVARDNAIAQLPAIDLSDAGARFFDELCALAEEFPPATENHRDRLASFGPVGIEPGATPSREAELTMTLATALPRAIERIEAANFFFSEEGGWRTNRILQEPGIADPLVRAAVNYRGPAFHLAPEALYFNTLLDADGEELTGQHRYVLEFEAGRLPPIDDFWSLTMYTGLFCLVANPIDRYVINQFTTGLTYEPDGALVIRIQHETPKSGPGNWLPAPDGAFMLFLRMYSPQEPLLNGSYALPRPRRIEQAE